MDVNKSPLVCALLERDVCVRAAFLVFSLDVVTGQHRDGDNDLILSDNSTVMSGNISEYLTRNSLKLRNMT